MDKWPKIARRIRVPVGFVFTAVYLWLARPTVNSILTGLAFVMLGLSIRALASGQLKKNEQLATSGPYAYTRNPLYLGSLIVAMGFSAASLNWWVAVIAVIIFWMIYLPVIQSEEAFLRAKFPEFENYAREVPRLFPRLTAKRSEHNFAWELYLKHREYNAAVGSAALILALVTKLVWRLRQ